MLLEQWSGSAWQNWQKLGNSYDGNNNMLADSSLIWNGSTWVNNFKDNYTYNNNLISTHTIQTWQSSMWVNSSTWDYTYDSNNNQTGSIGQTWSSNTWVNDSKSTNTFDANNLQTGWLNQTWGASAWVNSDQGTQSYDANNNLIEIAGQSWNGTGWDNSFRIQDTYSAITAVETISSLPKSYKLSNNYPNPFNPSTTIKFSIPKQSFVTLKVYDLLGREVASLVNKELQAGSYKTQFNASNLASGVYLYRLNAGGFVQTKKLMLMK
jgi:hypothetical protein